MTILAVLAAGTNSSSSINDVEPGLLGFLVVAALAAALVFLLRSMNKQFRKIGPRPEDVEADAADEAVDNDEATDGDEARDGDEAAATGAAGPAKTVTVKAVAAKAVASPVTASTDGVDGTGWASSSAPAPRRTRAARPRRR